MKVFKILLFSFVFLSFLYGEEEDKQVFTTEELIINFKKEIQEYYKSPECFFLSFRTDVNIPGYGKESAEGSVRADNLKDRIRIVLIEPNLGITLSWITIIQNQAYMSNPRQEGVIQIPLSELELGSLVNNKIKIPFSLFKDILFGKLPGDLLISNLWEYNEYFKGKYINEQGDIITFYFDQKDKKRIQKIEYLNPRNQYIGIVNFQGKFYDTKYPKTLVIQTYQNKTPLESMTIYFYRYLDKAWCKDHYFPIK